MKKKALTFALLTAFAVTPISVARLSASPAAQDRDQDRDHEQDREHNQDRNRDRDGNDSAYRNNRYYQQGWKDGEHHKHKNHHWKNDDDRRAYEAGYAHGDRGERWDNGAPDR